MANSPITPPCRITPEVRERVRLAVAKAIAVTKARDKRRAELMHAFLKTIHIPLT